MNNRESTPQFYDKLPTFKEQYYLGREEVSNQDFLGIVLEVKDNMVLIEERNYFKVGDVVEFFGPNIEPIEITIKEIFNEDMEKIDVARHPKMHVYLKIDNKLPIWSMMRLKIFDKNDYL